MKVHVRSLLKDQLLANANDRSWYISYQEVVEGLTDDEAFWKPNEQTHSIAEITQHLIYWNEVWQERYEKADLHVIETVEDNAESFFVTNGNDFEKLKEKLLGVLLSWQELLSDNQQLDSNVNGFPVKAKWWELIGNATTHNAYHIGQIAYIRKLIHT